MEKISLIGVSKRFKSQEIFKNVDIEFHEGKIYGLIGTNGCGKTLLLKIISGLARPSEGVVLYNTLKVGEDIKILPNVGVIFEKPEFFLDLTGYENLKLLADINRKISNEQIIKTMKLMQLNPDNKNKMKNYSLGMTQRLGIAQAIMEDQKILLLDEPTNALDEEGVEIVHKVLREMKENKIIILTSHNKYDINELCDYVYSFNGGEIKLSEK